MKKILSAVICAALLVSTASTVLPLEASAEESDIQASFATLDTPASDEENQTVYTYDDGDNEYKYVILDDGTLKITEATCRAYDVVIPKLIAGRKVTVIGRDSFRDNIHFIITIGDETSSNLNSITVPDGVKVIERNAFTDLDMVKEIKLSDTVEEIAMYAFSDMDILESVKLPDSLKTVGDGAFSFCPALKNVELPNSLESIGEKAFSNCTSVTDLDFPKSLTSIDAQAFANCKGLTDLDFPKSLTSIGEKAFANCTGLTDVVLPDFVASLGENAFVGCTGVKTVKFGSSLTDLGDKPFEDCVNLEEFKVSESNANYSAYEGVLYNKDKTVLVLYPNAKEGSFVIPESVKTIGKAAFYGSKITGVAFPSNLERIDIQAFYNCTGLSGSCEFPESLRSSGSEAFYGCSGITEFYLGKSVESFDLTGGLKGLMNIFVSEDNRSYTDIDGVLFYKDMSALLACPSGRTGSYAIPDGIDSIHFDAFCETSLTSVSMTDSVTWIGEGAFEDGRIESIRLSENLNSIGWGCFDSCENLVLESVPSSVKIIYSQAFQNCTSIQSFVIPENVEQLGSDAFCGCTQLKSVEINSDRLKEIERMTFAGCSSLSEVKMPIGLEAIDDSAFQDSPYVSFWCYNYSVAKEFAENNNIPYDLLTLQLLRGDVNRDGRITAMDSYMVLRMITKSYSFDVYAEMSADADNDGRITSLDSLQILRYSVGYKDESQVNTPFEV